MKERASLTVGKLLERLGVSRKIQENLGFSGKKVVSTISDIGAALAKGLETLQQDKRVQAITELSQAQEVVDRAIRAHTQGKWGYLDLVKEAGLAEEMRPDALRGTKVRQAAAKGGRGKSEHFGFEKGVFLKEAKRIRTKQPHLSERSIAKLAVDIMIRKHDFEYDNTLKKADSLRKYLKEVK